MVRRVFACVICSVMLLSLSAAIPTAWAGDEEPPEPKLTGEALKKHKKQVKAHLKKLKGEKNKVLVKGLIEELGAEGSRSARDALMKFIPGNKNQEWVSYAYTALAKIGDKPSIEFLCGKHALRAKGFLYQQSAANALAEAKSEHATGPLLDVMTNKRTKIEVVGACAKALAQSSPDDERVIGVLFKQSKHRKDTIRSYTLEALGYLKSDEAIERLREALFEDKNTRARGAAATGMMNSGRADTIPMLKKARDTDKSMTVKDACMRAIEALTRG